MEGGGDIFPLPFAFLGREQPQDFVLGTREMASSSSARHLGKRPVSQSLILSAWVGSVSVQGTRVPPGLCPQLAPAGAGHLSSSLCPFGPRAPWGAQQAERRGWSTGDAQPVERMFWCLPALGKSFFH